MSFKLLSWIAFALLFATTWSAHADTTTYLITFSATQAVCRQQESGITRGSLPVHRLLYW